MQPLRVGNNGPASPDLCARELLAGVPLIMRFIRHEMRRNRQAGLTVPQFRALIFLSHSDDASLSAMAEHVGLSLPAASRMVDLLVRRGLLARREQPADRRRVSLSLTPAGREAFESAWAATQKAMAQVFGSLTCRELTQVKQALGALNRVFAPENCQLARL